ncbi:MAG: SDR family oxidoreductase [Pseudomonadota bacterium]
MADLSGKTAVITGAASGIGRATVDVFVEAGAQVVAADIQDALGEEIVQHYGEDRVRYVHCDVTSRQEFDAAIRTCASAFGGVDILFNNAGAGGAICGIEDFDSDGFDMTVNLLLKSVFLGAHLALPYMKERGGGSIVNTSSISAIQAGQAPIIYSLCKAAVAHFSKVGAAEMSRHNVRVNSILPGLIGTHIFGKGLGLDNKGAQEVADRLKAAAGALQPVGRIGQGRDVAELAAFLASDAAAFITGGEYVIDGGATIGPAQSWQSERPLEGLLTMLGFTEADIEKFAADAAASNAQ